MPPIKNRNTRSGFVRKEKSITKKSIPVSSNKKRIGKTIDIIQVGTKSPVENEKQSFSEQGVRTTSDELTINPPLDQQTYTMLQSVPFDLLNDADNLVHSPPPLIIDTTTEDIISSQLRDTDLEIHNSTNAICNIPHTPLGDPNSKESFSNNVTSTLPRKDFPIRSTQKEILTNNNRINVHRTPAADKTMYNAHLQTHSQPIVVSVGRTPRDSTETNRINNRTLTPSGPTETNRINRTLTPSGPTETNRINRTLTPSGPNRPQYVDNASIEECDDSYSLDSISPEVNEVLSRFIEFRRLVKAYKQEKSKCQTWANDYARLLQNYNNLEESTFPRPPPTALNYLVDLVTLVQRSNGGGDKRSDDQLAKDMGINSLIMKTLKDRTPQQTVLNVFNRLYPGYAAKVKLGSIDSLDILNPGLLEAMLVFAQRSAPGVVYKMQDLRVALGSCIRGARFQMRKSTDQASELMNLLNTDGDQNTSQGDNHQTATNNNSIYNDSMEVENGE